MRGSTRGRWRVLVLVLVHVLFIVHFAHWKTAGETLAPMEPSEAMWTLELGYVNAGFLVLTASILLTAVLGRFFCGWLCHFVAYQDGCAWVLRKLGLRPRPVRSRLLVFVPMGAALYMFVWPSVRRWLEGGRAPAWRMEMATTRFWETFPGPGIAVLTVVVCGFLLVWWLGAKGFCTYGCPYGAFFGVADRVALGRIRVTDACETCGHCTAVCTSGVRVHEEVARHRMVVDPGCMKCMDCVSACPKDALYYGFGKPPLFAKVRKRKRPASDFSFGEEVALAIGFLAALWAFRSAYNLVPFLLALGLSVLTAIAVVTLSRVLRREEVTFQSAVLVRGGQRTKAGNLVLAGCALWLAFGVHTAVVRWETVRGESLAFASADPELAVEARRETLDASFAHLQRAAAIGVAPDSALEKTLGLVQRDRGEVDAAERHLRRAIDLHPHAWWPAAALPLADLLVRQQRVDDAETVLRGVLAEHPELVDATVLLARTLVAGARTTDAIEVLERALARHPLHPRLAVPLAGLLGRQGRFDASVELLSQVIAAHPRASDARSMLDSVERARGR